MTFEIALTYGLSLLAIILFVSDKLRPDLVAIVVMLLLPLIGLLSVDEAFSGLSSNAVVSIIAVMIVGYGIERSGLMKSMSRRIVSLSGNSYRRVLISVCLSVGLISSFMQNIGAAALFLPAVRRISDRLKIPLSKLLMPMGFSAILGGTLTMVASGPLIVLNDLLVQSGYERFGLFNVAPVGIILLLSGIICFYFLGEKILPDSSKEKKTSSQSVLKQIYNIPEHIYELVVPVGSPLIGMDIESAVIDSDFSIHILALYENGSTTYAPWRKTKFNQDQTFAVLGDKSEVKRFSDKYRLLQKKNIALFEDIESEEFAGFAEIIVPPSSSYSGKTIKEISFRKHFSVEPVLYIDSSGNVLDSFEDPLNPGHEMIVFGRWSDISHIKGAGELVVVTELSDKRDSTSPGKKKFALASMVISLAMIFLGFRLSLSFFIGALLMILSGVVPKDEVYNAVDWKTVFLLSGLIPLGIAFEKTGAAKFAADKLIALTGDLGTIPILFMVAILSTVFSLFMSNVAATILLVPLVFVIGEQLSIDARALSLLVAICASNSFILPTHQVNAFLMTPGRYKSSDYLFPGGVMTAIFLVVSVVSVFLIYL